MTSAAFHAEVKSWGLKRFSVTEVGFLGKLHAAPGHPAFGKNTEPPRAVWPDLKELFILMDLIRFRIDKPILILSAYRSPAYQAAINPKVPNSQHILGKACDWRTTEPVELIYPTIVDMRDEGVFKGGIGYYPDRDFLHVDVRGWNADWTE